MTTLLGLPKVSTENSEEVPTTSSRFSSGLPSVSILRSTGMRKVSRSWAIFPMTRKPRSEEHTSELQSLRHLVCRLLVEKKHRAEREVAVAVAQGTVVGPADEEAGEIEPATVFFFIVRAAGGISPLPVQLALRV